MLVVELEYEKVMRRCSTIVYYCYERTEQVSAWGSCNALPCGSMISGLVQRSAVSMKPGSSIISLTLPPILAMVAPSTTR